MCLCISDNTMLCEPLHHNRAVDLFPVLLELFFAHLQVASDEPVEAEKFCLLAILLAP
jgi:hypothetical protein